MKLLIIHAHNSVKTKWIEPLRNAGWGVMCVSNTQEADQVLQFHGRSLSGVVLHREQAGTSPEAAIIWFEQFKQRKEYQSIPTAIVSGVWVEKDFIKHQNSAHSANIYLADSATAQELKAKLESFVMPASKQAVGQNTSLQISAKQANDISLEDVSMVLSKPELTSTHTAIPRASIALASPKILLGGKSATESSAEVVQPEVAPSVEPIEFFQPEVKQEPQHTVILSAEVEPVEDLSFDEEFAPLLEEKHEEMVQSVPVQELSIQSVSSNGDLNTLKNYLSMREQDVAVLTGQVRSAQERVLQLEVQLKVEKARSAELQHAVQRQEQVVKSYDLEKKVELEVYAKQIEDLNVQLREKSDKIMATETKLKFALEEVGKIKERVRVDLRRIRVREKDLESQLEILKKDSAALLMARDEKITELKRKIDLLEFNMELVQEQYSKERNSSEQLRQRLKDASVAMKQAGGYLDHEN